MVQNLISSNTLEQEILTGKISGYKWHDLDGDGYRDENELGLAGWTIYLDQNNNGQLDEGEIATVTDESGNYVFTNLLPGAYRVLEVLQPGWTQTVPFYFFSPINPITQLPNQTINLPITVASTSSGNSVAWVGNIGSVRTDREIYLYNGSSFIQLTDNTLNEPLWTLRLSGNNLVWESSDGNSYQIFYYDGDKITQLTNNPTLNTGYGSSPEISGNKVVWSGFDGDYSEGDASEIYLYDGQQITQLTDNTTLDFNPKISGNNVVWQGWNGNDPEIFLYDGQQITQLSDNDLYDEVVQILDNKVVWLTQNGNGYQLYYYNGTEVIDLGSSTLRPRAIIFGNKVVWYKYDGTDSETFLYDGVKNIPLTDNTTYESFPQILGNNLVWWSNDTINLNSGEIITNVNFGNWQPATISGSVWEDLDGDQIWDEGEAPLAGWTIYLDANHNGWFDFGDTYIVTDELGQYSFTVAAGTYTIAEVVQRFWRQTTLNNKSYTVSLSQGDKIENLNFGNQLPIEITGYKWNDLDKDGYRDEQELGLAGWTIYLDQNKNNQLDEGEISTITDENGQYKFTNLLPGSYNVAEVLKPNWTPTARASFPSTVTELNTITRFNSSPQIFGNKLAWIGSNSGKGDIFLYDGNTSTITQLTDNTTYKDSLQIFGNNVVWRDDVGSDDTDDTKIYLYDGSTITQLTNNTNTAREDSLQISGNNIVWRGYDGTDYEIYLYNGSIITQLTNNTINEEDLKISGNNIVWRGYDGTDYEIYLYDGSTVTQLTDNTTSEYSLQISGNNVVWSGYDGTDYYIYFYDGSTITELTNNRSYIGSLQISGNNIVWSSDDGNDYEIYLFDGNQIIQLSNNFIEDSNPKISDTNVVWLSREQIDYRWETYFDNQLYYYDGVKTIPLTDKFTGEYDFQISDNKVIWSVYDNSSNNGAIYLYDEISTIRLTDESSGIVNYNPKISGNNLVWDGYNYYDYNSDNKIYILGLDNTLNLNDGQIVNVDFGSYYSRIEGTSTNDQLTGTPDADIIYGLEGNDTINAGSGDDVLDGGAGSDRLLGGTGNDVYIIDNSRDVIVENVGEGKDKVEASVNYTLAANVEDLTLTGTANINGTGNNLDNIITGNSGNNLLKGLGGNDQLIGEAGNDTVIGGAENDTLTGGEGSDQFLFGSGAVFTTTSFGVDTLTDFTKGIDKIVLSKLSFASLSSAVGGNLQASELAIINANIANEILMSEASSAKIIYNLSTGNLLYNQNGNITGLGSGGLFATLTASSQLEISDFLIQN